MISRRFEDSLGAESRSAEIIQSAEKSGLELLDDLQITLPPDMQAGTNLKETIRKIHEFIDVQIKEIAQSAFTDLQYTATSFTVHTVQGAPS